MAARRKPEFTSDAPSATPDVSIATPGTGLVLGDNVHFKGEVYPAGTDVASLPEALRTAVLANPSLAVKPE